MNKDAILATIIGFGIGLCITASLLLAPKLLPLLPHIQIKLPTFGSKPATSEPVTEPGEKEFTLTIDSPLPEAIESEEEVLISGSTLAGTTVIIQSEVSDVVIVASNDGKYAGKVSLLEGSNDITVTGYNNTNSITQAVVVFYTEEEL